MPGKRSSGVTATRTVTVSKPVPPAGEPGNAAKVSKKPAAPAEPMAQTELMPALPPSMQRDYIDPATIIGPRRKSTEKFVDHVRGHGIVNPLVVRPNGSGGFDLIGGSKRLWAAERLQLPAVPVTIVEGEYNSAALAIADNAQRSDNPGRDLAEIEVLVAEGHGYDAISLHTGLPKSTIQRRMRLQSLSPYWRGKLDTADLRASFAESIAKLPKDAQKRLELRAENGEKVTGELIAGERTVQAQTASTNALEGFDDPANDLGAAAHGKKATELLTASQGVIGVFKSGEAFRSPEGFARLEAAVARLEAAVAVMAHGGNGSV
jgi:ParB-like chromosome segregation protein Spo0J